MFTTTGALLVSIFETDGVSRALVVTLALNLLRVADGVGVTHVAMGTLAQVAAFQIEAEGI